MYTTNVFVSNVRYERISNGNIDILCQCRQLLLKSGTYHTVLVRAKSINVFQRSNLIRYFPREILYRVYNIYGRADFPHAVERLAKNNFVRQKWPIMWVDESVFGRTLANSDCSKYLKTE